MGMDGTMVLDVAVRYLQFYGMFVRSEVTGNYRISAFGVMICTRNFVITAISEMNQYPPQEWCPT